MSEEERSPTRRDLLGGSLFESAESVETGNLVAADDGPLFTYSANAMGCQFQMLCASDQRETIAWHAPEVFQLIAELEAELSIYRESSPLSAINRLPGGQSLELRRDLFELMSSAIDICLSTDGAFDITATPLTQLWKTARRQRQLPDPADIQFALSRVGAHLIHLDEAGATVSVQDKGVRIDLGGIGKGYALDRVRQLLLTHEADHFLIHGGQSSVVACGQRGGQQAWQVGITHPLSPGVRLAQVTLQNQSIGTSGSGRQSFVVGGKRYGHIIDPRTGWPADHMLAATVIADSAMMSDALATAICVAGFEQAQSICDRFGLSAILVAAGQRPGELRIEQYNIADDVLTMHV